MHSVASVDSIGLLSSLAEPAQRGEGKPEADMAPGR